MFNSETYCLTSSSIEDLRSKANSIFDLVWRFDLSFPGFAVINIGPEVDSRTLRFWMVMLKERLSDIAVGRGLKPFAYLSMSRFDQQQTTKFHLDGAPVESLLMLGYEPSKIISRILLADYVLAAKNLGITPQQFLADFNPMFSEGEKILSRYVTELPQPVPNYSRIVLINNSSLPMSNAKSNPLGVMHTAVIEAPDPTEPRVINSTMLATGIDETRQDIQQEFLTTDLFNRRTY